MASSIHDYYTRAPSSARRARERRYYVAQVMHGKHDHHHTTTITVINAATLSGKVQVLPWRLYTQSGSR